jgi:hypothetical protein
MASVPLEAVVGAIVVEGSFGEGLDTSAGLLLVAGEDDETLDEAFVCKATEFDRPLVDNSVATKVISLVAEA